MRTILLASAVLSGLAGIANAQAIENACLRSDRDGKGAQICGCIQDAANLTLTPTEQRLASSFYSDPQKAQDLRQSPRRAHIRFWQRYKDYTELARTFCG